MVDDEEARDGRRTAAGRSTSDGAPPPESRRSALEAEHERLVGLRRAVRGDVLGEFGSERQELSSVDRHPGDSGPELEDRERDQSFLEQLEQQLRDVDDAISRLDRGEYGLCEVCGQPIGEARLEALPATRFCLLHQELAEREVGRVGASGGGAGPVSPI